MFVFDNILIAMTKIILSLTKVYFWVVIIAVALSWIRPDPYNPIVRTIYALTEPVFYRVRKWLPFTFAAGIDFSPFIVLIAIELFESVVIKSFLQFTLGNPMQ